MFKKIKLDANLIYAPNNKKILVVFILQTTKNSYFDLIFRCNIICENTINFYIVRHQIKNSAFLKLVQNQAVPRQ